MSQLPPGFEYESGLPVGFEPEPLNQQNWSQVANAQIEKRRRERMAKTGQDLNQNEQAAIMDAYREAAGLPMLSNVNTFQRAQHLIASGQGDLLNLARSTSQAFEKQGVTLSGMGVWEPEWARKLNENAEVTNPADMSRFSGAIGSTVASLPILLATGGLGQMAGVFGLQSGLETLQEADTAGVTGPKKYWGALGKGATTAGAIALGGKLGEWATNALTRYSPKFAEWVARYGVQANKPIGEILAQEAAQAGINLPPQITAMLAGTVTSNMITQQTTDPNRQWHEGLGQTALFATAMTLGMHAARAGELARAPRPEVAPTPQRAIGEEAGVENWLQTLPDIQAPIPPGFQALPREGGGEFQEMPRPMESSEVEALRAAETPWEGPSNAPAGPTPEQEAAEALRLATTPWEGEPPGVVRVSKDTLTASKTPEGITTIDQTVPRTFEPRENVSVDVDEALKVHEDTEIASLDAGKDQKAAHLDALEAEHNFVLSQGADPAEYEAFLQPYESKLGRLSPRGNPPIDQRQKIALTREEPEMPPVKLTGQAMPPVPAPLPAPVTRTALPQPKGVVVDERAIAKQPEGKQVGTPHAAYAVAEPGKQNPWIRPTKDLGNKDRTLLVQFSTHLINAGRPRTVADDYYDALYAQRPGYSRPTDFWELPQWIGQTAHNLPKSDVYVVRNMDEAKAFLAKANYGTVAFSALDANAALVRQLAEVVPGKVAIGGYTNLKKFADLPNVKTYDNLPDFIKDQGKTFENGSDYRHFKGTEVQPRLCMSTGCLHKCGFCSMPRTVTETPREAVQQQIKSFGDLNYRLVYLNDKTFGQASNYKDLVDIRSQLEKANPNFEGFIIQTTAAQMKKFPPNFLRDAGIKYVEIGVESYNDPILKEYHKPANEKMIDEATQQIRAEGAKLIPNIVVGFPEETPATYQRTLDYLDRNRDVISHVNVNNLSAYEGTELTAKTGGKVETEQNVVGKSFHTPEQKAAAQAFYDTASKYGIEQLKQPVSPPGEIEYRQAGITGAQMLETVDRLTGGEAGKIVRSFADDVQKTFAPATRGEGGAQAEAALRETGGGMDRKMDQVRDSFKAAHAFVNKGLATPQGKAAMVDFMDRINQGQKQSTPELQSIADGLDTMLKSGRDDVRALGTGALERFYEDYFPKQFKQPGAAAQWASGRSRTLTGPKSFLKHRLDWDLADAIKAGFEPMTYNPVEMAVTKYGELQKYVAGVRALKVLEANGWVVRVQAGKSAPAGWVKIHDKIGLYQEIDPETKKRVPGTFYAQREVADLINNHLSPGLRGKPWFSAIMGAGNMLNQFQLGLSTFHIGFTGVDAMASKWAQAIQRMTNYGDIAGGLKDIMGIPTAPITTAMQGHKAVSEWLRPGTQGKELAQIVKVLEEAGARTHIDELYRTHISDHMMQAFRQGNLFGGVLRGLMLPLELPTRAVMKIAMYQKWGIATDLVRMEMKNNPNITHQELVAMSRKIWDSADNRMGQLVYNNLFWNKTTKDLAMLTTRSVGWNLGTFRELLGGAADIANSARLAATGKRAPLTYRAAYLIAMPTLTAAFGAILQYMFTGKGPAELKDYFFPQTGGLDERGRPARVALPTYMKDIYHYGIDPLQTLSNKIHPLLTMASEMVKNKDFYGVKIRNEDDPFMQKRLDELKYLGRTLIPLSIRNYQKELESGTTPQGAAKAFLGVTPAPKSVGQTEFEQALGQLRAEKAPIGGRTQESADRSALENTIRAAATKKDFGPLREAIQTHKITPTQAREIVRESTETPLQQQIRGVGLPNVMRKYDLATPAEKDSLRILLLKELQSYAKTALPDDVKAMVDLFRQKGIIK